MCSCAFCLFHFGASRVRFVSNSWAICLLESLMRAPREEGPCLLVVSVDVSWFRQFRWMLNSLNLDDLGNAVVSSHELVVIVTLWVARAIRHLVLVPVSQFVFTRSWCARHQVTTFGENAVPCPMAGVPEREAGPCHTSLWLAGAERCQLACYVVCEARRVGSSRDR